MNKPLNYLSTLLLVVAVGCSSLYTGVVTLTSVVDSAMKNWASLSVAGKSTPQIDTAVMTAHGKYRQAASVAQTALIAYKNGGNQQDYLNALVAVRSAAGGLVDLIVPLLTPSQASTLQSNLSKAVTL